MTDSLMEIDEEYQASYEVIRHAMTLATEGQETSRLQSLKNILYYASVFVDEEMDKLPDMTEELGLDKWQEEEKAFVEEREWEEEQERQMEKEWQEEERKLAAGD